MTMKAALFPKKCQYNFCTHGVLCVLMYDIRQKAQKYTVPTCVLCSQCLNKGVKAEHLMGADTIGNFMSPETKQQIS